ncbi:unnamed protein product [Bursaphelenchus xylophilus]|uniref:(pine wood nematode) hypothetical protein n=1 Tax=Bursaphelenchus xylophilus TaxID=6326 RepID=A0A811LFV3_BURXY|nr:unnamed protein product [Bursaphelenchus xylophilus]CAG9115959.1 unnamed protein product [Bursaphelenchus xylophilus]
MLSTVLLLFLFIISPSFAFPDPAKETPATIEDAEKVVETSAQHDFPFNGMGRIGNGYGMGGMGMGDAVSFDFNCKCQAKSNLPKNMQVPTDANQAAQQQINTLNEQIRRLNDQLRRTQQGQSTFEQFAQILSMADGLDCNCSGSSAPFNNFPFGGGESSRMGPMGGQMPFIPGGNMIASPMGQQRMFPGMLGMFP